MSHARKQETRQIRTTATEKFLENSPNIIISTQYELLDTITGKPLRVADRKLYEKLLAKDSGRYIKL